MDAPTIVSTPLSVLGRRGCAVLAACSAVLHGASVGHASNAAAVAVIVVMAAVCLSCAYDLWIGGTSRAWVLVATMNIAMVAVHTPTAGHRHGPEIPATAAVSLPTATAGRLALS